jgi:long-chain acyl-CoA synthetase
MNSLAAMPYARLRLMTDSPQPSPAAVPTPWLASYPPDVDWHAPLPVRSPLDALAGSVAQHPHRICIDFLGRHYTYQKFDDLVRRAAKGLQQQGVGRGVNVGLFLPNTPYYVILYYAILMAGGTVANLNPLYAEKEVEHLVCDAEIAILATLDLDRVYDKAEAVRQKCPDLRLLLCPMSDVLPFMKGLLFPLLHRSEIRKPAPGPHLLHFADLIDNDGQPERPPLDPLRDVAVLQFTGGTTGSPKAAMLTHANLAANTEQVRLIAPSLRPGQERFLGLLPLCHVFAMTVVMNLSIHLGATMILLPRFDLKGTLRTIRSSKPTGFPGVPAIYAAINAYPGLHKYDLGSIRFCISGGAPLPLATRLEFERNTGCTLVEGYGLSEASPVVTCNMFHVAPREGSIGLPVPGTTVAVMALDGSDRVLSGGARGEICVHGPQVMLGYRNQPEANAATLRSGWLHTGDVGYMDEQGYTFLVDRIKDVIIRDGYKAYPRVIEDAIREHDLVSEVCVVAIPDPQRGAFPLAFVQLKKDASLTPDELRAFLKPRLSPIEMPKEFAFRSRLPRTLLGKPDKKALVEEVAGGAPPTA